VSTESATTDRRHSPAGGAGVIAGLIVLACCAVRAAAASEALAGLTLPELVDRLERDGAAIFYSSDLVKPWMRVRDEPTSRDAHDILQQALAPYGLAVATGPAGVLMIVPAPASDSAQPRDPPAPAAAEAVASAHDARATALEEVIVHASRYRLVRDSTAAVTTLSAADLELLPDLGDDALRAVARLPGMASSDLTAKVNVRGGVADETLVRFDGLRLYNPFHLKDFQSPFSSIDPRLIRDIDAYAGGFPACFGDRMSGVLDIASIVPLERTQREVSLSFFNLSALAAGTVDDAAGDWLVSGRRGNLDLLLDVIDPSLGRPAYTELHAHFGHVLTSTLAVAGNLLVLEDDILLYDSDQEENARANYRDAYYWLRFEHRPHEHWSGTWLLSHSRIESHRSGTSELPGVSRGQLNDARNARIDAIEGDWTWHASQRALLRFGVEWRSMRAEYDYSDEAQFDLLILSPGAPLDAERERVLAVDPHGDLYGAFASLRFEALDGLFLESGLRWDRETLTRDGSDHLSPRLSVSYRLTARTVLRAGWGRFVQPQDITELPLSDGVSEFHAPQHADHLVAGLEHLFRNDIELRFEGYRKTYDRPRPRFENLLNTFVLLPELKPDRVRIAPDRAVATGIELSLRSRAAGPLDWWIAYTWAETEDRTRGSDIRRSWDQAHQITAAVTWRQAPWDLSLAARYHSGWPTTELTLLETEPLPVAAAGPRNAQRLRPYLSVDARIARTFGFDAAGTLTVFLEVTNLLNRANDCCVEYEIEDEEEGLLLDVGRLDSLPMMPSLGFIWQF